jgi:RNA polymerase sigma factor (sigma-70 family)
MSTDEAVPKDGQFEPAPDRSDRRAEFETLFRQHNDALLSYAYARVHSWQEAKDIIQEAYCRIFDLAGRQHPINHLRAYLFQTAGNIANDRLRKNKVRQSFASLELFRVDRVCGSPEQLWLQREELECVQKAIEALPPKCKIAMTLVRYEGLSYEEAAVKMGGVKVNSVRRLVERSIEYLLEAIAQDRHQRRGKR